MSVSGVNFANHYDFLQPAFTHSSVWKSFICSIRDAIKKIDKSALVDLLQNLPNNTKKFILWSSIDHDGNSTPVLHDVLEFAWPLPYFLNLITYRDLFYPDRNDIKSIWFLNAFNLVQLWEFIESASPQVAITALVETPLDLTQTEDENNDPCFVRVLIEFPNYIEFINKYNPEENVFSAFQIESTEKEMQLAKKIFKKFVQFIANHRPEAFLDTFNHNAIIFEDILCMKDLYFGETIVQSIATSPISKEHWKELVQKMNKLSDLQKSYWITVFNKTSKPKKTNPLLCCFKAC